MDVRIAEIHKQFLERSIWNYL